MATSMIKPQSCATLHWSEVFVPDLHHRVMIFRGYKFGTKDEKFKDAVNFFGK